MFVPRQVVDVAEMKLQANSFSFSDCNCHSVNTVCELLAKEILECCQYI